MKKITRALVLLSVVTLFAVSSSRAQEIVVGARLGRPGRVMARPERPSPRHVWVGEEWAPSGNTYAYQQGYWAVPPQPGGIWIKGHWRQRGQGYIWIKGYWR